MISSSPPTKLFLIFFQLYPPPLPKGCDTFLSKPWLTWALIFDKGISRRLEQKTQRLCHSQSLQKVLLPSSHTQDENLCSQEHLRGRQGNFSFFSSLDNLFICRYIQLEECQNLAMTEQPYHQIWIQHKLLPVLPTSSIRAGMIRPNQGRVFCQLAYSSSTQ